MPLEIVVDSCNKNLKIEDIKKYQLNNQKFFNTLVD